MGRVFMESYAIAKYRRAGGNGEKNAENPEVQVGEVRE
jgi:hypothetical protein